MESVDIDAMRTADRVLIVDGMRVWDYNLERGVIDLKGARWKVANGIFDGWFDVRLDGGGRSLMNADRVCVRHPFTREEA